MLIHKKPARAAAVTLALFFLASCSKETPGNAGPVSTPGQSSPSGTVSNQVKAPPVKDPLDVSKFSADPCLTLTSAQVQKFKGSKPGSRSDSDKGVGCYWNFGADGSIGAAVSFIPSVTNGLTNEYRLNAAGFFKDGYFVPVEIDGYPAAYSEIADNRAAGHCGITVGVSDQSIFAVLIQGQTGTDGCKAALNVAKEVLHTIQGGQ